MVTRVRRALGEKRAGHTGTLDPFATGLMVVLVGRATRLARFVEGRDKTYLATARLGLTTDTLDATGAVTGGAERLVSDTELELALQRLRGPQRQRPPAFSAKHVAGTRAYHLARRGEAVELPPVEVMVHELSLVARDGLEVTFRTRVSSGTYVRAMARELGEYLGTGAHLTALRREAIGDLDVGSAVALDALSAASELLSPRIVLRHLPVAHLSPDDAMNVRHGRVVAWTGADEAAVALLEGERLVGIAEARLQELRPRVVLEDPA